jgi:delta 1-pyrroline-5-carboxylate dehydrogenase
MNKTESLYARAYAAWESWNLLDFDEQKEQLQAIGEQFSGELKTVFDYQFMHAGRVAGTTYQLVSPTGETNELYTTGRGVSLLVIDASEDAAAKPAVALLTALLTAGNSVIVCCDNSMLNGVIMTACMGAGLSDGLVQFAPTETYRSLFEDDIRNVAFVGEELVSWKINKLLAARPGVIVPLVAETDLQALPVCSDPMLALRFITERTCTTNITAIGGNAMLLELSNDGH